MGIGYMYFLIFMYMYMCKIAALFLMVIRPSERGSCASKSRPLACVGSNIKFYTTFITQIYHVTDE